ncbi:hypothetical protein BDZ88DRAFT_393389, partial [Geranomyces variabilis]
FDENYEPTDEEIVDYAKFLGIDPDTEPDLLWIARQSLKAPLPPNWKPWWVQISDSHSIDGRKKKGFC